MIHNLTAGHFNEAGLVTKPIDVRAVGRLLAELGDVNADGEPTLGGWKVRFEAGCVILPWKGGTTNRVTEAFAVRLQEATGCTLADREHGRIVRAEELAKPEGNATDCRFAGLRRVKKSSPSRISTQQPEIPANEITSINKFC